MSIILRTLPFSPSTDKYQSWKEFEGENYDYCSPLTYIRNKLVYEEILLFSQILFPSFIVKDGAIFLEFLYSDEKFDELSQDMSLDKVEETMNQFILEDFFQGCKDLDLLNQLADILAFSWRFSLRSKISSNTKIIYVFKEDNKSPIVTFFHSVEWTGAPYYKDSGEAIKLIHTLPFVSKVERYRSWKEVELENIVLFSQILFPTFIVRDEAVFLEFLYSDEKFDRLSQEMSLDKVEETMNQFILEDFFCGCKNRSKDLLNEVADILALSWSFSLKELFSDEKFTMSVSTGEGSSPMISFSQSERTNYENKFTLYNEDYWREKYK